MKQIEKPIDILIKAAGKQKMIDEIYRSFTYIQEYDIDGGFLLYNLLTRELVFLNAEERLAYNSMDVKSTIVKYLIENWFLVPINFNDYLFLQQINHIAKIIYDNDTNQVINAFVIFPTTDCNARCFYCFEHGCNRINMSEQTAKDIVEFIIKKSDGKEVYISWFGGEPLYNLEVIDVIINGLIDNGIKVHSSMVSNAYLFDEKLVYKAKNFWNLEKIQITLDGTEEIYNKVKAYIYKDNISPYIKVLNNIELLLNAGITVRIRLNLDKHNYYDLEILIRELLDKFAKYKKFSIYISLLYENAGKNNFVRSKKDKELLWNRYDELNAIIESYNIKTQNTLKIYRKFIHCMADSNQSTMILPDGSLGKCENYIEDNFYGSIYSDSIDRFYIDKFKELSDCGEQCQLCALQPKCLGVKACPNHAITCDEFDKKLKIKYLKKQMLASYRYFNENNKTEEINENFELCD